MKYMLMIYADTGSDIEPTCDFEDWQQYDKDLKEAGVFVSGHASKTSSPPPPSGWTPTAAAASQMVRSQRAVRFSGDTTSSTSRISTSHSTGRHAARGRGTAAE